MRRQQNFNNPIYTGTETIPLEELSDQPLLESSDEENVTHFFKHVALRLQASSDSEDSDHSDTELVEMIPVSDSSHRAGRPRVSRLPTTYETFQLDEHAPSRTRWRCPNVRNTACAQAFIHSMRSLTHYQVHPLAKTGCKVLLGVAVFTLVMALILYFAHWDENAWADATATPASTLNPATTDWMTLFSDRTEQTTTEATQTTSIATTSPALPTPDPRCELLPDCCDGGEWICTR